MLRRLVLLASLACAVLGFHPTATADATPRGAYQIGQDEPANIEAALGVPRLDRIVYPSASYISVKFADFDLPPGDQVVVRSPDMSVAYSYVGKGRGDAGSFYATFIPGPEAVVEYIVQAPIDNSSTHQPELGFRIAGFARGVQRRQVASICGADQTKPAKCYAKGTSLATKFPLAYERAQPVARLLIGGSELCTGWLIGSEGHLITNQHCIETARDAASVDIEFDAESTSCSDECRTQLGCKGTVVATSVEFITSNETSDYAIVKLPTREPVDKYGYLQIRARGPVVNEPIYIPQHPRGTAKRIAATVDSGGVATIASVLVGVWGSGSYNEVSYMADTEGGSSGSPVIAAEDNAVVALHHAGGCRNSGVDVRDIVADLEAKRVVIPNMLANGKTTPRPTTPAPPATTQPPPSPTTPAPTTPPPTPAPGDCVGLDNRVCDGVFFCSWDALANQCLRWWN